MESRKKLQRWHDRWRQNPRRPLVISIVEIVGAAAPWVLLLRLSAGGKKTISAATIVSFISVASAAMFLASETSSKNRRRWATSAAYGLSSYLGIFTILHWSIGAANAGAYSEPLSKPDALYFTVTTMTTTGFGDVSAVSTTARMVVVAQMLTGLTLLAVLVATFVEVLRSRTAKD